MPAWLDQALVATLLVAAVAYLAWRRRRRKQAGCAQCPAADVGGGGPKQVRKR